MCLRSSFQGDGSCSSQDAVRKIILDILSATWNDRAPQERKFSFMQCSDHRLGSTLAISLNGNGNLVKLGLPNGRLPSVNSP